jgi:hypothetical protein
MGVSTFSYNFSQNLNSLTSQNVRITFFRGQMEYLRSTVYSRKDTVNDTPSMKVFRFRVCLLREK